MGKIAQGKADGRTRDAKRLAELRAGVTDSELQAEVLAAQAASLILAGEKLAAAQVRGEPVSGDELVRIANVTARLLADIRDAETPKPYWQSQAELERQAEVDAYLSSLSESELLSLRDERAAQEGLPPRADLHPLTSPIAEAVPYCVHADAERYAATLPPTQKQKDFDLLNGDEGQGQGDEFADWVNCGIKL